MAVSFGIEDDWGENDFDRIFAEKIKSHLLIPGNPKTLKVLYDPVFGTGQAVLPDILRGLGYNFSLFPAHSGFNGDFPDLDMVDSKGKPLSPDPADKQVLAPAINYAAREGFDVVVATDPDADRCGIAFKDNQGSWQVMKANDLWSFLTWVRINLMQERIKKAFEEYRHIKDGLQSHLVTSDLLKDRAFMAIYDPGLKIGNALDEVLEE